MSKYNKFTDDHINSLVDTFELIFPNGKFKPLFNNEGLFIYDNKEQSTVFWTINKHGLLTLTFDNGLIEYYVLIKEEDTYYDVVKVNRNTDTGKYKKDIKFRINFIEIKEYKFNNPKFKINLGNTLILNFIAFSLHIVFLFILENQIDFINIAFNFLLGFSVFSFLLLRKTYIYYLKKIVN